MKYKDYDDYEIHPDGTVVSYKGEDPKMKKPSPDKKGYMKIWLYKNGKGENLYVHRIVAECFIPNIENKETVNHKDFDKSNNHIDNLEWMSLQEQIEHCVENDRQLKGESVGHSKLTEIEVLKMRKKHSTGNYSLQTLADENGVSKSTTDRIVNRKTWKHI